MNTRAGKTPRRRPTVAATSSSNRVAAIDLTRPSQAPVILAGSAALVWNLMDGDRSFEEIAAELGADALDIASCVDQLVKLGLAVVEVDAK